MENIIVYIYNKNLELIGQPYITSFEEFIENPQAFYPEWNEKEMYASKDKLQYPIIDEVTKLIREKTQEELKIEGIISLEDGEYVENGKLIKVEYDESLGYYKKAWDKENHIWIDLTTDYDRVQAQYREYEGMDTPSTIKEMELQDPALLEEYITMMIELRALMYSLQEQKQARARIMSIEKSDIDIPQASKALEAFKNKFNSK